jgi:hypothetical protein
MGGSKDVILSPVADPGKIEEDEIQPSITN